MSTMTPALRTAALRGPLAGLSLLERLGMAVAGTHDIDDVDELAVLLHDTSCECRHTAERCREFRTRRFHRWAWEMRQTIQERVA